MARKRVVLFRGVKSFLKPIILGVLVFSLIVGFGEKSPLLANQSTTKKTEAAALIQEGKLLLEKGLAESALERWEEAENLYREIGNYEGIIGSQLNQGLALEAMGFTRDSCDIILAAFPGLEADKCDELNDDNLEVVIDAIIAQPSPFNWMGLESLGNRLRFLGKFETSELVLNDSLAIANSPEAKSKLLLALGNTKLKLRKTDDALNYYEIAANIDDALLETRLQALLNQLSLLIEEEEWEDAEILLAKIRPLLASLPLSQFSIEAKVNLAGSLLNFDVLNLAEPLNYLELALAEAETIENRHLKSLALGKLGNLYEEIEETKTAKNYTQKALNLAQSIQASEQAYQWQWQWGRLLEKEGDLEGAIAAYTASVNTLQTLRGSLTILNRDLQFDFRERVEPVYRKLVELLLVNPVQKNLILARDVIELLQLAELDNFFQEACARVNNVNLDKVDANAAVISTIFLPDRSQPKSLEIILSLPNNSVFHYSAPPPLQGLGFNTFLEILTTNLKRKPTQNPNTLPTNDLPKFQEMYDWLIEPIEENLTANNIETLVFVLDGLLQNVPMAALHDGEKYLIEKYAIAVTPGLQLLASRNLETEQIQVLAVGRSEFQNDDLFSEWNDLDNVKEELAKIAEVVPVKQLLNQQFTTTNLREEINSLAFPFVHIATHAKFDSTAENTFIIVWGEKIQIDRLGQLLRVKDPTRQKDIDLLILSACQTAQGNERTALGMAGVAIRAGARSTLASLWNVNDRSTAELMAQFYQKLKTSADASNRVNKAEALRQAQITMLKGQFGEKFQNPHFWAPFILVGHWL